MAGEHDYIEQEIWNNVFDATNNEIITDPE